jgi:organic radical activating enzyme
VRDFKGSGLIDGVIDLVDRHRRLHVSIVGGEPLVRYKELNAILPLLGQAAISHAARHQRGSRDPERVGVDPD